jgi:hypothetical protein
MGVPISPLASREIIFEIGIGFGNFNHLFEGKGVKGRSSQIGMDDDSCGIDDPPEVGLNLKLNLLLKEGKEAPGGEEVFFNGGQIATSQDLLAQPSKSSSDGFQHHGSGMDF